MRREDSVHLCLCVFSMLTASASWLSLSLESQCETRARDGKGELMIDSYTFVVRYHMQSLGKGGLIYIVCVCVCVYLSSDRNYSVFRPLSLLTELVFIQYLYRESVCVCVCMCFCVCVCFCICV